jgi:hypothetical protein
MTYYILGESFEIEDSLIVYKDQKNYYNLIIPIFKGYFTFHVSIITFSLRSEPPLYRKSFWEVHNKQCDLQNKLDKVTNDIHMDMRHVKGYLNRAILDDPKESYIEMKEHIERYSLLI